MDKFDHLIEQSHVTIDEAVERFGIPGGLYAMFSGGHDSLTATHVASLHPAFRGAIHIDTTIGIDETQQFVRETCKLHDWPLAVIRTGLGYKALIISFGFPGPANHGMMYQRLKERPLMEHVKRLKKRGYGDPATWNVGLVSGIRKQESERRMLIDDGVHKQGSRVWIPVIAEWSALDVSQYIESRGLCRNPVKDRLHISGECLCGCFARPNERREIEMWYPHVGERLNKLEDLVRQAGEIDSPIAEQYCRWGWGEGVPSEQMELFPMCHFCRGRGESAEHAAD